ncbi:MAG: hypothetical protein R6V04_04005 [bacterium]
MFRVQKYFDSYKEIKFVNLNPVFLPDGEILKWLSMGFRGITADYLWIRSVLYYGRRVTDPDNPYYRYALKTEQETLPRTETKSTIVQDTVSYTVGNDSLWQMTEKIRKAVVRRRKRSKHVEYIYPLLDRVTTVDPHFEFPYIFGGVYLLLDTHDIDDAYNLLKKGFAANKDSWKFPFYLGWIEWMYKRNPTRAVEYILQAVDKQGCPDFVESVLSWLMKYIKYKDIDHDMITKSYLHYLAKISENKELKERINDYLQQMENN